MENQFEEVSIDDIKADKVLVRSYYRHCSSSLDIKEGDMIETKNLSHCRIYRMWNIERYYFYLVACPNENVIIVQDLTRIN